jgi:hypothetical protein
MLMATYILRNKKSYQEFIRFQTERYGAAKAAEFERRAEEQEEYAKTDPKRACCECGETFKGYTIDTCHRTIEDLDRDTKYRLDKYNWILKDNKVYCPKCIRKYFEIGLATKV